MPGYSHFAEHQRSSPRHAYDDTSADFPSITTKSAGFRSALERLERYAAFDNVTVLLEGETGTGKTFFARRLHAASPRKTASLHHVNLAALDDALASSELFGHVAGAFTGASRQRLGLVASASGATLFLDEIGKASESVQCRLLGALEHRSVRPVGSDREIPVDVRIVAATNVPLDELVRSGRFLPDLVPRLGLFRVRIPPLRERRVDIPGLVHLLVSRHAESFGYGDAFPVVDIPLMHALQDAEWPGNVRELDAAIQRILATARCAALLRLDHCDDNLEYLVQIARSRSARPLTVEGLEAFVRELGSISEAARSLRVARSTIHRQLRRQPRTAKPRSAGEGSVGPGDLLSL